MKRLLPILLAAALLATACGETPAPAEPGVPDTSQAPALPPQETGQAGQEAAPPQEEKDEEKDDDAFAGLDLNSLDLLGDIVSVQESSFTFTPLLMEEHSDAGYSQGMVAFEIQPAETIFYTPETEWGWVLYDIANNTTRLTAATPADMQAGMSAYIWGSEQADGFVAEHVMLHKES